MNVRDYEKFFKQLRQQGYADYDVCVPDSNGLWELARKHEIDSKNKVVGILSEYDNYGTYMIVDG